MDCNLDSHCLGLGALREYGVDYCIAVVAGAVESLSLDTLTDHQWRKLLFK